MANVPPPPPGFVLDGVPPPPPGFILDKPKPVQTTPQAPSTDNFSLGNAPPASIDWGGPFKDAPVEQTPPDDNPLARALTLAAQDAGRGLAGAATMPIDTAATLFNMPLFAAEQGARALNATGLLPFEVPENKFYFPTNTRDLVSEGAGLTFEDLGGTRIPWEERTPSEQTWGNVAELGTEAGASAAGLVKVAAKRAADMLATGVPKVFDDFLRPYFSNPTKTVVGDVAGGAGAGAGVSAAQAIAPDNPLAAALGVLMGGFGGSLAPRVANPKAAFDTLTSGMTAKDVPVSPTDPPVSNRIADQAAALVQNQATDPAAAATAVRQNADQARAGGYEPHTTGVATGDTGLLSLERGQRQRNSVPFIERDDAIKGKAQEDVDSLMDPNADQAAALDYAKGRPDEIAADRDAAALPLLRQAEQSGAVVNAQPVADLIDDMLTRAKRPAVRSALEQARTMLNKVGTDELDTSVSGLYETRKAINDIIEGRTDTPTGRYAKSELIAVRNALDAEINRVVPEFGQYLDEYRGGSKPLDIFEDSQAVARMVAEERDVKNVAKSIFGGNSYGTEKILDEINTVVGGNAKAREGWKAAVAEVLSDIVSNTDGSVSYAKLAKTFEQHEAALAKVFTPEEMSRLRQAHKMLEPFKNLGKQVTPGSPTEWNKQLVNSIEAGILAVTGNAITTGMVMKRLKVMFSLIPGVREFTAPVKVDRLISRMFFDPRIAEHLLTRDIKTIQSPAWNRKLNQLMGVAEFGRTQDEAAQNEEQE